MRRNATQGVVLCTVAAFLFGASTPLSKRLLSSASPTTLAGVPYLVLRSPQSHPDRPHGRAWWLCNYGRAVDPRWNDGGLAVVSDDRRTFRYRLLQSWYRETVLGAQPGSYSPTGRSERSLGSLLHRDELRFRPELNFLNAAAYAHALERIEAVRRSG